MRILIAVCFIAASLSAQNFTDDEVFKNPARFRQVIWEETIDAAKGAESTVTFPANISTYRMPSCEFTNGKTGKPARLIWTKLARGQVSFRELRFEKVHIACMGYELKPWRTLDDSSPGQMPPCVTMKESWCKQPRVESEVPIRSHGDIYNPHAPNLAE